MTDFEDRLEQELTAAARREAAAAPRDAGRVAHAAQAAAGAAPARRHSAAARRRRPRPLPVAAVALAAILALAVAVVALPGGDARHDRPAAPAPAAGPLPRECDRRAAAGEVRLTAEQPTPRLLEAFAVLRRPQTDADRAGCHVGLTGLLVNPATIRLAGRDERGHRIFLVPVGGLPDWSRRTRGDRRSPADLPVRRQPTICSSTVSRLGAGGSCQALSSIGRGRFFGGGYGRGTANVLGLFTDGVAAVEIEFLDGSTRRVPVHSNVATVELRGRAGDPAVTARRYRLLDADGATIATDEDPQTLRLIRLPSIRPKGRRGADRP